MKMIVVVTQLMKMIVVVTQLMTYVFILTRMAGTNNDSLKMSYFK